ncbi:MAG TPA: GNAT family N-acetyltransferase [Thermoanaerobaculia bacterium]|nr:GNAT family N-acetyltransferase [Thermoanaerobaculia bacterium]
MLRDVVESDLRTLFEHQLDSDATRAAGFPARDWDAFLAHWKDRVFADPTNQAMAIIVGPRIAGYVASWDSDGKRMIAYWTGREYWGRGVATAAVNEFLRAHEQRRPIYAYVAIANVGSIRVLEKCGFHRCSDPGAGPDVAEEFLFQFDGTT